MPFVAWIVRWIGFLALAGLVGGFVVDLLVLPVPSSPQGEEGVGPRRRLRRLARTG